MVGMRSVSSGDFVQHYKTAGTSDVAIACMKQRERVRTTFVCHLAVICALDLCGDADEGAPEGVFRRGEQHLLLDLGIVWGPVRVRTHAISVSTSYPDSATGAQGEHGAAHQEKKQILFLLPAPSFSNSKSYTAQRHSYSGRSFTNSS